jgi:hypothetical protein
MSLLNLIGGFFYADQPNIVFTTIELINVSISGWVLFTIFIRIDTDSMLPPEAIRKSKYETQKLLVAMYFVPSARISTRSIGFIIEGRQTLNLFGIEMNSYLALFITVFIALLFGLKLYKLSQRHKVGVKRLNQENPSMYSPDIQYALSKFISNLTEEEQSELSTLTLHTDKVNKVTFINLAKICWSGLFLAWLFEVLVELIQRL